MIEILSVAWEDRGFVPYIFIDYSLGVEKRGIMALLYIVPSILLLGIIAGSATLDTCV
jgi:hypothetical protein